MKSHELLGQYEPLLRQADRLLRGLRCLYTR